MIKNFNKAYLDANPGKKVDTTGFYDIYEVDIDEGENKKVRVTVTAVKVRNVPELDDELAQDVSDKYNNLEDMKNDIKKNLETALENKLKENGNYDKFEKTLVYSTYMLAGSFLLSSVLNFALAKYLIHSPTGTEEFSQELAKMTGLSYPVIALPSTLVMLIALFYLIKKTSKLTGFEFEELLAENLREENK